MYKGEIIIYQAADGNTQLDVKLDNDTVWLSLTQMADLFNRDKSVISRHISNIFKEEELDINSVVAKNATTAKDGKIYKVDYYNLDVIISIGYRVKSQQGTQFRIWANKVLKDYLIKGFAINQQVKITQLEEAIDSIKALTAIATRNEITDNQAHDILQIIKDYTYGLDVLDDYDYQNLEINNITKESSFRATYESAMRAIETLRERFGSGGLFGNEKDESFKSSINTIYQTFGREDLYPSVEEKAAMLLYLVVKNHSFSDGNKRIAAFLFLWFLENNGILYKADGSKLLENNTLVALTLMIAESRTEEKDIIVKVIVNLINRNN